MIHKVYLLLHIYLNKISALKKPTFASPRVCLINRPNLYLGISSETLKIAIIDLQIKISEQGFPIAQTGQFDKETEDQLKKFQRHRGLTTDGKAGSLTWSALLYSDLSHDTKRSEKVIQDICTMQEILKADGLLKEVNGIYDKKTISALKAFQRSQRLVDDGKCGPRTWSILLGQRTNSMTESEINSQISHYLDWVLLEQFLIIIAILVGMYVNPLNQTNELSFLNSLAVSYALTWVGPLLFENTFGKFPVTHKFPIFRFAPYVIIGFSWRQLSYQILTIGKTLK